MRARVDLSVKEMSRGKGKKLACSRTAAKQKEGQMRPGGRIVGGSRWAGGKHFLKKRILGVMRKMDEREGKGFSEGLLKRGDFGGKGGGF